MSKNDRVIDADTVVGFKPDREIRVWAMSEQGALDFFGFSAYDKIVRVIQDGPQTDREKEKYTAKSKLFGISRVREPSTDETVTLAVLLRDAALLLREARPFAHNNGNWSRCYIDLMKRIAAATEGKGSVK